MNKYSTFLAGSALLATTALASGTVSAASIQLSTGTNGASIGSFTGYKIGNTLFTGAASSAVNSSTASFDIRAGTTYTSQSTRAVLLISGGEFDTSATAPTVTLAQVDAGSSLTNVSAVATANVTVFTDRIIVGTLSGTWSVMHIEKPTVKNLQSLGTPGNIVTVSGRIENPNVSATYENIDTSTYLTSVVSASVIFATSTNANGLPSSLNTAASVSSSPPFINFGVTGGSAILTATVGSVSLTLFGALGTSLSQSLSGSTLISTAELKITHGALADPAFNSISIRTGSTTVNYKTATQIAAGVATFSLTGTTIGDGTSTVLIDIGVVGSTVITGGAGAGAATLTPTASNTGINALAAATGNLASIGTGGLSTSVNTFQNSFNSVAPSFLRLTNQSTTAGTYTITIRNGDAASGAILGTYTGATVQPQGTVQLSAATLETGAGLVAPTAFGNYQLAVSAKFNGYVQHLSYASSRGLLSNLSELRQGATGGQALP